MMIDTSVLCAILLGEPGYEKLLSTIISANEPIAISAAVFAEAMTVIEAKRPGFGAGQVHDLLPKLGATITSFTKSQALIAALAFRQYGKGRHSAALNFGDCLSYAAANETGERLFFKGQDFAQTDVKIIESAQ